jgi:hypothetical protein
MIAMTTADADIRKLFFSEGRKSWRDAKSAKLAKVGEKTTLGGIDRRSSLVLKAAIMIHMTGRKKMSDTSQSTE